jgi:tRNA pseudouridine synthase 10
MRWVEYRSFEPAGENLSVRLRTEHGTYVKEAIHGERGATRPSLSELLGVPCACLALDVIDILDVEGTKVDAPPVRAQFGANV